MYQFDYLCERYIFLTTLFSISKRLYYTQIQGVKLPEHMLFLTFRMCSMENKRKLLLVTLFFTRLRMHTYPKEFRKGFHFVLLRLFASLSNPAIVRVRIVCVITDNLFRLAKGVWCFQSLYINSIYR